MRKFYDTVASRADGDPVAGARVRLLNPNGSAAAMYDANGKLLNPPIATNNYGYYEFYSPNGTYQIQVIYPGSVTQTITDVQIYDLSNMLTSTDNTIYPPVPSSRIWICSPTGSDTGAGTIADPISLNAAVGNGGVTRLPTNGAVVQCRGGTYSIANRNGVIFAMLNPGEQITLTAYPGETPVFSNAIQLFRGSSNTSAWQPVAGATVNLYESVGNPGGVSGDYFLGFWKDAGGTYHLLCTPRSTDTLQSTSGYIVGAGEYYAGPSITGTSGGVKARIRLDGADTDPLFGANTPTPSIVDPRSNDLMIFNNNSVCFVLGTGWVLDGLTLSDAHTAISFTAGSMNNIIRNCVFDRIAFRCVTAGGAINWTVEDCDMRSPFERQGYIRWQDVKGGSTYLIANRPVAIDTGGASSLNGKIRRNKIGSSDRIWFDGLLGNHYNLEVGGSGSGRYAYANPEDAAWTDANTFYCLDDGAQMPQSCRYLHIHHNYFFGAGVSRDGTTAGDDGDGNPVIHHNIFDSTKNLMPYFRKLMPTDVDPYDARGYNLKGYRHPWAMLGHGGTGGPTTYEYNWTIAYNTIIWSEICDSQNAYLGPHAGTSGHLQGDPMRVFNNLIYDPGNLYIPNGHYRVWNDSSNPIVSTSGRWIADGNVRARPAALTDPNVPGYIRFLFTSTSPTTNININNITDGLVALRPSGGPNHQAVIDSQAYYAPGWEATGIDFAADIATLVDLTTYRPLDARLKTGAADMSTYGLNGLGVYNPWRGARSPLS